MAIRLQLDSFLLDQICSIFREIGLDITANELVLTRSGTGGFNRVNSIGRPKKKKDCAYFVDTTSPVIGFFAENNFTGARVKGDCWNTIIKPMRVKLTDQNGVLTNDSSTYYNTTSIPARPVKVIDTSNIEKYEKKSNEERILKVRTSYQQLPALNNNVKHSYFIRKGFPTLSYYGLKYSKYYSAVVIPIFNIDGQINSAQYIYSDEAKQTTDGVQKKVFGPYAGCFYILSTTIQPPVEILEELNKNAELLLICEGFATALSIHSVTKSPTVVAIAAGNIPNVVKAIKEKYRNIGIVICGDRDKIQTRTVNGELIKMQPGHQYIKNVFSTAPKYNEWSHLSIEYIFPEFNSGDSAEEGGSLSDFNDIQIAYGDEYLYSQLISKFAIMFFNNSIKIFKQNQLNKEFNNKLSDNTQHRIVLNDNQIFGIKKRFTVKNSELHMAISKKYKEILASNMKRKVNY